MTQAVSDAEKALSDRPFIVLIGFCGNTFEIFEAIESRYRVLAILDDAPHLSGRDFAGVPVQPLAHLSNYPDAQLLCLIGSERSYPHRDAIIARLNQPASRFATFIHPRATVSRFAQIGEGTVIYAGAVVTANASIGRHVLVLPNTLVHHDTIVEDHCLIGSNVTIAGNCRIGDGCYVGSASSVKNGISVGAGALIGMASNVVRDVDAGAVVAGNPARPMPSSR